MVKINYSEVTIDHLVAYEQDNTVFAAARDNFTGHLRLFLIDESTGGICVRNCRTDSWEELMGGDRDSIIARLIAARNNQIPVYRINGSHN